MKNLSIIILTYNEELNLDKCLQEAKKLTDDIVIVDSYSTDKTLEIAKKYNCRIYQHEFINQAKQLNWALENIEFRDWILRLDADEYFLPELIEEMKNKLDKLDNNVTGIFFKRRVYFMGKWIKYGGYYPTLLLRCWRNKKAICEDKWMDEHMRLLEGESIVFENDFVDDNKKNLNWWINKHNNYATREAIEQLNSKYNFLNSFYVKADLFGTQEQRKKWLKDKIYNKLPLGIKPILYFIYRYFFRLGFLDGRKGLFFHILQGFWYRFLVDAKVYEVEQKAKKQGKNIKEVIEEEYEIKL